MNWALEVIIFIVQVLSGLVLLYAFYRLFKFYKSYMFDKRFGPYAVEVLDDEGESLFDSLIDFYKRVRNKLSSGLLKSKLLTDYSKKYERYSNKARITSIELMNYISNKIFIGLFCVFLLFVSMMFKVIRVDFFLVLFVFLVGFFFLDVYLLIIDKIRMNRIEKDMGKAIIVMNNAFKSGYSIMQALYLVYTELEGPISVEFKKMYMDISFGLSMEVVFKRFADRVKCVEASYMSTSLMVLNKTGGNIVQVFNSVERSMYTRKKLKDELESVSASARAVFKLLVCIPIFLVGMLLLLNPSYFNSLFKTPIGIMCLLLSITIYVLYIVIIKRIVYVEVKL